MLKRHIFTATAVLMTTNLTALPSQAQLQENGQSLNTRLQQAVCAQNWRTAVRIVDQMIALTPPSNQIQRGQLIVYRGSLENFAKSRTSIPDSSEGCAASSTKSAGDGHTPQ